ncbi:MAG: sensor histidine kinase [Eubacteriales bacterium]|nr:sensor histidine kinase [Eubacteriales bacterium]
MKHTDSIKGRLRRLVIAVSVLLAVLLAAVLLMLGSYSSHYSRLLHNVTTASEFNRDFKDTIDQRMYYYVIESQYSQGLPIEEVRAAQSLAKALIDTTYEKNSRQAITSVLDLCENLERKIYQIEQTLDYDQRLSQLENNVYVLTSLVEEYMYTYLYYEASELNAVQQVVTRQAAVEIVLITAVAALTVVFFLRYSIRLSRSITRPLEEMCRRAEKVTGGDLTVQEPVPSEIREIRTLSQGMEQMLGRLDEQMRESRQRQESLRRTELALLQAQINPHFLYNTMDTIIWLIEADKQQEAVEMVSNLSSFFRHSLSRGEDVITLAEEECHVRSYLQIQHARYKDIMEYTVDIDPRLHDAMLPKLTLQPLVENALYHGIKLKRAKGTIRITGRLEDGCVLLRVEDNGVGMTKQRLTQLRGAMAHQERVGFGLSAVNQRLVLQFGPEYGLSLTSEEGVGTIVTARIPYVRKEAGKL